MENFKFNFSFFKININHFQNSPIKLNFDKILSKNSFKKQLIFFNYIILIKNCIFNFCNNLEKKGGAISLKKCNISIKNSIFNNNSANSCGSIDISDSNIVIINNSLISNSKANRNGGAFIDGNNNNDICNLFLTNFSKNKANLWTGGLRIQHNGGLIIYSIFFNNTSNFSGAIFDFSGLPSLRNITLSYFISNISKENSSGFVGYKMLFQGKIDQCYFFNNFNGSILIFSDSSNINIFNFFFEKNLNNEIFINFNTTKLNLLNNSII